MINKELKSLWAETIGDLRCFIENYSRPDINRKKTAKQLFLLINRVYNSIISGVSSKEFVYYYNIKVAAEKVLEVLQQDEIDMRAFKKHKNSFLKGL